MEVVVREEASFQPEMYCLRCEHMEWDDQTRMCANFEDPICPLAIRSLLAGLKMDCLVI